MSEDIQKMFQSEYNRNLDEIIKFSDILSKTLINYLLDGEIKNTIIEDQSYDSTTIKYIGTAYSREPSLGKNIEIIRRLEGILTIEGEKLVLELKKRRN
jgi:flagellin-specific chaperone FliS